MFERRMMGESLGTLGATRTSTVIRPRANCGIMAQVIVAGNTDAVGTIKVQGSNDGTNWKDVTFTLPDGSTATTWAITAGLNDSEPFLFGGYVNFRIVYTRTSGGAAATCTIALNEVSW